MSGLFTYIKMIMAGTKNPEDPRKKMMFLRVFGHVSTSLDRAVNIVKLPELYTRNGPQL